MLTVNCRLPDLKAWAAERDKLKPSPAGPLAAVTKIDPKAFSQRFEAEKNVFTQLTKELLPKLVDLWTEHLDGLVRAHSPLPLRDEELPGEQNQIKLGDEEFTLTVTRRQITSGEELASWRNNLQFILTGTKGTSIDFETEGDCNRPRLNMLTVANKNKDFTIYNPAADTHKADPKRGQELITLSINKPPHCSWLYANDFESHQ